MSATETDVLVTRDGPVGIVTINRPERLNAVTPSAGERLSAAFQDLEADPSVRAAVLTGAGRGFCAGADIAGDVGNARDVLLDTWNPLIQTMQSLELPIIAAINGWPPGPVCRWRWRAICASPQSRHESVVFHQGRTHPGCRFDLAAPRVVGLGRANELALLARDLHAPEALQWGLVNRVSEDGGALDTSVALARDIAGLAGSVTAVKWAFGRTFTSTLAEQLEYEAHTQGWLQEQPDFIEATKAFGEKRAPDRAPRQPGLRP